MAKLVKILFVAAGLSALVSSGYAAQSDSSHEKQKGYSTVESGKEQSVKKSKYRIEPDEVTQKLIDRRNEKRTNCGGFPDRIQSSFDDLVIRIEKKYEKGTVNLKSAKKQREKSVETLIHDLDIYEGIFTHKLTLGKDPKTNVIKEMAFCEKLEAEMLHSKSARYEKVLKDMNSVRRNYGL